MPRTRLSPRTALRLAPACDAIIALFLLAANRAEAPDDNAAGLLALDGRLTVTSIPGEGTTVTGTVPA